MTDTKMKSGRFRRFLMSGTAALALSGAFVMGGALSPTTAVYADAVKVEAPKVANFADVVEAVSPAVVSVRVTGKVAAVSDRGGFGNFGLDQIPRDHPLREFFERFGGKKFGQHDRRKGRKGGAERPMGQGSGFFVSQTGYIVTNNHVVAKGSGFTVVMDDGEELEAELIGTDPKTDLAVLKVEDDREFTYVQFTETPSRVGEWVVAVGNPFGLGGTVTAGIVSASGRDIGSGPYDDFLQIDAAVNKGNSGGPAFNLNGEVIGVNTAIFSPSGGNVGIAFAISADTAEDVVTDLIEQGKVTRGWLGVQIQPISEDIAESLGLDSQNGALVSEAQDGSPADKAGIRSGDVIVTVDDEQIDDPRELARFIAGLEPNQKVDVTVIRAGKQRDLQVTLGKLPEADRVAANALPDALTPSPSVDLEQFGLSVVPSDDGVVVSSVDPDGSAASKGLREGDRIVSINGNETRSVNDIGREIARAMEDDRKAVLFQVQSQRGSRFVALPVEQG